MKKVILLLGFVFAFSVASFAQTTAADWNKKGEEMVKKFDYKAAYECFTKAIEQQADFGQAYYNRAMAWFQLPAHTFAEGDGCVDLKKAKELGIKVKDENFKTYGCK